MVGSDRQTPETAPDKCPHCESGRDYSYVSGVPGLGVRFLCGNKVVFSGIITEPKTHVWSERRPLDSACQQIAELKEENKDLKSQLKNG